MQITLRRIGALNQNLLLSIQSEGPIKEDEIIKKWHEQIIEHMKKLNLK